MQHDWKHVERPGGSHSALDGKKVGSHKDVGRKKDILNVWHQKDSNTEIRELTAPGSSTPRGTPRPCGYMLNVVSRIDNTCKPYLYRGEDCIRQFVEQLTEIKKYIFEK